MYFSFRAANERIPRTRCDKSKRKRIRNPFISMFFRVSCQSFHTISDQLFISCLFSSHFWQSFVRSLSRCQRNILLITMTINFEFQFQIKRVTPKILYIWTLPFAFNFHIRCQCTKEHVLLWQAAVLGYVYSLTHSLLVPWTAPAKILVFTPFTMIL